MPHHRLDFAANRALPKCNQRVDYVAALTSWVRPSVLDDTAERVIEVRIKRLPDGGRSVDVRIKGADGEVLSASHHDYSPTTECFKVLFLTAHDTATLLGAFVPAPAPPLPSAPCPVCPPPPAPPPEAKPRAVPKAEQAKETPRAAGRFFVGAGIGAYGNFAPEPFFAPRAALGWNVRSSDFVELDFAAEWLMVANPKNGPTAVGVNTYIGTLAVCHRFEWLAGCGLITGGALHAVGQGPAFGATSTPAFFGVGLRGGLERTVIEPAPGKRLSLRAEIDALLNFVTADLYGWGTAFWEPLPLAASGTASVVYTF